MKKSDTIIWTMNGKNSKSLDWKSLLNLQPGIHRFRSWRHGKMDSDWFCVLASSREILNFACWRPKTQNHPIPLLGLWRTGRPIAGGLARIKRKGRSFRSGEDFFTGPGKSPLARYTEDYGKGKSQTTSDSRKHRETSVFGTKKTIWANSENITRRTCIPFRMESYPSWKVSTLPFI